MKDQGVRKPLKMDCTLLEDIPAAKYHAGTCLAFSSDENLYITTGDATNRDLQQDPKLAWRANLAHKCRRKHTHG